QQQEHGGQHIEQRREEFVEAWLPGSRQPTGQQSQGGVEMTETNSSQTRHEGSDDGPWKAGILPALGDSFTSQEAKRRLRRVLRGRDGPQAPGAITAGKNKTPPRERRSRSPPKRRRNRRGIVRGTSH